MLRFSCQTHRSDGKTEAEIKKQNKTTTNKFADQFLEFKVKRLYSLQQASAHEREGRLRREDRKVSQQRVSASNVNLFGSMKVLQTKEKGTSVTKNAILSVSLEQWLD